MILTFYRLFLVIMFFPAYILQEYFVENVNAGEVKDSDEIKVLYVI